MIVGPSISSELEDPCVASERTAELSRLTGTCEKPGLRDLRNHLHCGLFRISVAISVMSVTFLAKKAQLPFSSTSFAPPPVEVIKTIEWGQPSTILNDLASAFFVAGITFRSWRLSAHELCKRKPRVSQCGWVDNEHHRREAPTRAMTSWS